MAMSRIVALCSIPILAGACSSQSTPKELLPVTPRVIDEVFGGSATYEIVKTATSVSTCRMKVKEESLESGKGEVEYDLGPFVAISNAQAVQLRRILESPNSYLFDLAKACIPIYGVRIRFDSPEGVADVDLCFECDSLTVSHDGKPVGGEDFNAVRPELVALCKEWFPDDPEIQKLKKSR